MTFMPQCLSLTLTHSLISSHSLRTDEGEFLLVDERLGVGGGVDGWCIAVVEHPIDICRQGTVSECSTDTSCWKEEVFKFIYE